MERIIGEKYKLGRKIGSGSFGVIYLGLPLLLFFSLYFWIFRLLLNFIESDCFFMLYAKPSATHIETFEIVAVKIVSFLA